MQISSALIFLILILLIIITVNIYLFRTMKGDVDFSQKKTRVNLLKSIIWVLLLWFYIPTFIVWFYGIEIYRLSDEELGILHIWRISLLILLAIPVWKYWVIKPLYNWIKGGSDS